MARDEKGGGGLLLGLLAGGVIGAAAALFLAPKSGKEVFRDIKKKSDEFKKAMKSEIERAQAAAGEEAGPDVPHPDRAADKAGEGASLSVYHNSRNEQLVSAFADTFSELLSHKKFRECSTDSDRFLGHASVFYGFLGAAGATTLAVVAEKIFRSKSPFRLISPIKILGNLCGIAMLAGSTIIIKERLRKKGPKESNTYEDWVLVLSVAGAASSGLLAETARMTKIRPVAYGSYYLHLVLVFFLLWYAPYSKLAHMFYRTLALVHMRLDGRSSRELVFEPMKQIAAGAEVVSN